MRTLAPATLGRARVGIDGRWLFHRYPGIGRYVHGLLTAPRSSARDESFVVAVASDDGQGRLDRSALEGFDLGSPADSFGLPLLEAMACGTAVSCSAIAPLAEVAGDAALTFDPLDVESIAVGLGRLIRDDELRAELARRGSEQVQLSSRHRTAVLTLDVDNEVSHKA